MRITKVALAFFSIGFLAGSFERAAGLGHSEQSRVARDRVVAAAVMRSTMSAMASVGSFGGLPDELFPHAALAPGDTPASASAGLAEALDWAELVPPIVFSPVLSRELHPREPSRPTGKRWQLGVRSGLSHPDRTALSRVPPPLSLPGSLDEPSAKPRVPTDREVPAESATGLEFILPFERGRVTSLFNQGRYHPAIDLAGSLGSRVHATTRRQRVVFAGWQNGYGNTVVTRDESGRMHLYGHLQRIIAKVGAVLDQGQMLGTLGSTGRSTGPHVHYEVKTRVGAHLDPVTLLFGRRVGRGFAWSNSRAMTRFAARADRNQPRPR